MRQSLSPPRMTLPSVTQGLDEDKGERYEIKCGKLLLMHRVGQRTRWVPVYVRVYRNAFEHFAVVSKDQAVSGPATYLNLKTSHCSEQGEKRTQFTVVQNNFEGTVVSFDTSDVDSVAEWVEAFSSLTPPNSPSSYSLSPALSPAIPRSPVMPTLPETDEEE